MVYRLEAPMRAYRIADGRRSLLDGSGAPLVGGRWNSPGNRVIYASETYAAALLEKLVHSNVGRVPRHQRWMEIVIPAGMAVEQPDLRDLTGWDHPGYRVSRELGDRWYEERRALILAVPSVVTQVEKNLVIHQDHKDFGRLQASDPKQVRWDERLFRKG